MYNEHFLFVQCCQFSCFGLSWAFLERIATGCYTLLNALPYVLLWFYWNFVRSLTVTIFNTLPGYVFCVLYCMYCMCYDTLSVK